MALQVFSVSRGVWISIDLAAGRTHMFLPVQKQIVLGQVWVMDNFWEQQLLLQVFPDIYQCRNGYQIHSQIE